MQQKDVKIGHISQQLKLKVPFEGELIARNQIKKGKRCMAETMQEKFKVYFHCSVSREE